MSSGVLLHSGNQAAWRICSFRLGESQPGVASRMTHAVRRSARSEGREVLLLESTPQDAALIHDVFHATGLAFRLQVVTDAPTALACLAVQSGSRQPSRPDLIILDLTLPQGGGFEVLRRVKDDARLRSIPVVILTQSDAHADVWRSYHLRANAYIVKPACPAVFQVAVGHMAQFFLKDALLPPRDAVAL